MFLGIQCGRNLVGHNRLDKGAFIYETRGVRWIESLGADDYNQPGFFGTLRYHYYRNRAEGHNTLVINPGGAPDQRPDAGGTITRFDSFPEHAEVVAQLTPLYPDAANVTRSVSFERGAGMTLVDEVEFDDDAEHDVWWFAHTRCGCDIDETGRVAVLTHAASGERLRVDLRGPDAARFEVMPARPLPTSPNPAGQNPNDGTMARTWRKIGGQPVLLDQPDPNQIYRKLAIHLRVKRRAELRVRLEA